MDLSPEGTQYIIDLSNKLLRGETINGLGYNDSIVSGPGVDDAYDPDMLYKPLLASGYWPDGSFEGRSYVAMQIGEPDGFDFKPNDERLFLRQLIAGSSIGAAALQRYTEYAKRSPELRDMKQLFGEFVVAEMVNICRVTRSPFAYMIVGTVLQSEVLPARARVAVLHYPYGVSPKTSLVYLRRAVRNTELEEML